LETRGREWLRVMPRSASSIATGLEVIDVPRSAWMACGVLPRRATASAMNTSASSPVSVTATCQSTT
jgi:hypothetical protein